MDEGPHPGARKHSEDNEGGASTSSLLWTKEVRQLVTPNGILGQLVPVSSSVGTI
jgi:hypothetical protein